MLGGLFYALVLLLSVNTYASNERICFVSELVAPFYYLDEQGKPQGANVDLANAMKPLLPVSNVLEHMPWARAYQEAISKPNVVLITLLKSPERETLFQWLGPVNAVSASLISLKQFEKASISNIDEAKSYRVGSIRGYGAAAHLLKQGFKENENLVLVAEPQQLWNLLYNRRIDYAATGVETSAYEIEAAGFDPTLSTQAFAFDMPKAELHMATGLLTSPSEVRAIKAALRQLKESGEYDRIMKKWGLIPLYSAPYSP